MPVQILEGVGKTVVETAGRKSNFLASTTSERWRAGREILLIDACVDSEGNSVRFSFSASSSPQTTASTSVVRSSVAIPFGGFPGSRRFK